MAAGTVRKLVVEARDLVPRDLGGQRRMTRTVARDLSPVWNEPLEFAFPGGEPPELEVSVFHDLRVGPSRQSNFLGRVRLDAGRFFVPKGEEALVYFPLQKKSAFGFVRGVIGLKVYYVDEGPLPAPVPVPVAPGPGPTDSAGPPPNYSAAPAEAAEEAAASDAPASADPAQVPTEDLAEAAPRPAKKPARMLSWLRRWMRL